MHVALEHAPQLRNLIQAQKSQILSHFGDAWIIIRGPSGTGIRLSILPHGAKLIAVKSLASASHPLLTVENRTFRTHLHCQSHKGNDRKGKDEPAKCSNEVHDAPEDTIDGAEAESFREDEPTGIQLLHFDASVELFQPGSCLFHLASRQPEREQLLNGNGSAPVGHGNNDAMNPSFFRQTRKMISHRLQRELTL